MPKSEVFSAPANHTKKAKEPRKQYYFENRKMPGQRLSCVMGTAPKKGEEQASDTINRFSAMDGDIVELTDSEYQNMRTRGVNQPVIEVGPNNERLDTGKVRLERRFSLDPV